MKNFPNQSTTFQLSELLQIGLPSSLAFDVIYHVVNTPRSYCIQLEENIESQSQDFSANALISLSTSSAEQILLKIQGDHEGKVKITAWSYDGQIIDKFMAIVRNRLEKIIDGVKKCDEVRLEDLRSGITILKELDRVYYYSLCGEKFRRVYFMLADSRERLYKIMIKGTYGSFNPALIEMQTYLNILLRHDQESPIKDPESMKVGLASLRWKRWIIILIQRILTPEEVNEE